MNASSKSEGSAVVRAFAVSLRAFATLAIAPFQ